MFDDASVLFSFPESPLDTASAHRFGGAGHERNPVVTGSV
jgi:hypothetical protein